MTSTDKLREVIGVLGDEKVTMILEQCYCMQDEPDIEICAYCKIKKAIAILAGVIEEMEKP